MNETQYLVTVKHHGGLPDDMTDVLSIRAYGYAVHKGFRCEEATAAIVDVSPLRVIDAEHDKRCIGHGAGPTGHQLRADCVNCQRRTAPRAGYRFMDPPTEFPCPSRIAS